MSDINDDQERQYERMGEEPPDLDSILKYNEKHKATVSADPETADRVDCYNKALEIAAQLVEGWHIRKGGFHEIAWQIRDKKI